MTEPYFTNIPYGYCRCGCGEKTTIAKSSDKTAGYVKGEPKPFVQYHYSRVCQEFVCEIPDWPVGILYGYCQCGCGEKTQRASQTESRTGYKKGQPLRFIFGHNPRKRHIEQTYYKIVDTGYKTPCWIWTKSRNPKGYGILIRQSAEKKSKNYLAHRYQYEVVHGPLSSDVELDHQCGIRPCINDEHLKPCTHTENMRRAKHVKLSMEAAKEIRARHQQGTSKRSLAKEFGVHPKTIASVIDRRTWAD